MSELREKIIRLAATNLTLRPHLLKILASEGGVGASFKEGAVYRRVEVLSFSGDRFKSYVTESEFEPGHGEYEVDRITWEHHLAAVERSFQEGIRRNPVKFTGEEISGTIDLVIESMPNYESDGDVEFLKALRREIDRMRASVARLVKPGRLDELVAEKQYWSADLSQTAGAMSMGGELAYLDKRLFKILEERRSATPDALRAAGITVR